tara:strand:- start:1027 stop:1269 length:243 start_codon:yes stop_codon:yes gene_type:complete
MRGHGLLLLVSVVGKLLPLGFEILDIAVNRSKGLIQRSPLLGQGPDVSVLLAQGLLKGSQLLLAVREPPIQGVEAFYDRC